MAIVESDIKLLESERLTENPDGGGRLTGNVVPDGVLNNVFPDISSLDRTYGSTRLRKLYPAVWSPNTDVYYGAHLIIDEPPEDPNVYASLIDTESWTDERAAAADRIESYVVPGPEGPRYVFGDQIAGAKSIRFLQRPETELPRVGDLVLLSIEEASEPNDGYQQYLSITKVESTQRTFTDQQGNYRRTEVIVQTGTALESDFPGAGPTRYSDHGSPTIARETRVADAARYYSIQPLEQAAADGDLTAKIPSLLTPIVPATQAEDPVTDERALGEAVVEVTSGGDTIECPSVVATDRTKVTLASRAFNYTLNAVPKPAPGTVYVDYRAQGRWYRITDDGQGGMTGEGAGSVDYQTGTISVTLQELPDVPSEILWGWGMATTIGQFSDAAGASYAALANRPIPIDLANQVQPGTLTFSYESAGTPYSVSDDGSGNLTGDGTGRVWYSGYKRELADGTTESVAAHISFEPANVPDTATPITVDFDEAAGQTEVFNPTPDGNGDVSFTLTGSSIEPGGVTLEWEVQRSNEWARTRYTTGEGTYNTILTRQAKDDGVGGLELVGEAQRDPSQPPVHVGTIDYGTGAVSLTVNREYSWTYFRRFGPDEFFTSTVNRTATETLQGTVTVRYATGTAAATGLSQQIDVDAAGLEINLLGLQQDLTIVPSSVRLTWGGSTYIDNDGQLIKDPDPQTGAGPIAGTVNYDTGATNITIWPADASQALAIQRMVVANWSASTNKVTFRVPGPHRPGSFQVQAVGLDGTLLTGSADLNGDVAGDGITGTVEAQTGIADVTFPQDVDPGSIRYNAVAYYYVPLDPDILGLDPVRLPQDGRVPMCRVGDVAVVHNTQATDIGDGSTTTTLRPRLSYVRVRDAEGDRVPEDQLTIDLDAGEVTVDDATGFTSPFEAEHRIEDMLLVGEVQISGTISFARQLTHDYPAGESYLSSALLYGDLQASVSPAFSQVTWTGVWDDEVIGDETSAQFNDTDFPLTVTNEGAIQERWRLEFVDPNTVKVIGEYTGEILSAAAIADPITPTNPATNVPYFEIDPGAFGSGWSTGNTIRFNSRGANRPVWCIRTVLAGDDTGAGDRIRLQIRGDAQ